MIGTRIVYPSEGRQSRRNNCQKEKPLKVRIKKEICPFCQMPIAPADSERRVFLVHGKKIPFNLAFFKERCQEYGWEIPYISPWDPFDVEPWILLKVREIADMPVEKIDKQWFFINSLATDIGLKTNFFKAIRS